MAHHPTLGTWIQRDPAGYADGLNLREYGDANPVVSTDPAGLTAATAPSSRPTADERYELTWRGAGPRTTYSDEKFTVYASVLVVPKMRIDTIVWRQRGWYQFTRKGDNRTYSDKLDRYFWDDVYKPQAPHLEGKDVKEMDFTFDTVRALFHATNGKDAAENKGCTSGTLYVEISGQSGFGARPPHEAEWEAPTVLTQNNAAGGLQNYGFYHGTRSASPGTSKISYAPEFFVAFAVRWNWADGQKEVGVQVISSRPIKPDSASNPAAGNYRDMVDWSPGIPWFRGWVPYAGVPANGGA